VRRQEDLSVRRPGYHATQIAQAQLAAGIQDRDLDQTHPAHFGHEKVTG
jgi:hypothetical protein